MVEITNTERNGERLCWAHQRLDTAREQVSEFAETSHIEKQRESRM